MSDPQSRKWQITINNPDEKGFNIERIKNELQKLKSLTYFCLSSEIGIEEQTPHMHIYVVCSSPVRFSTLQKLFEKEAHLERANGTSKENRDYVFKEGKWEHDEKAGTKIPDTQYEWGELPVEYQGGRNVEATIIAMIQDGATNAEILLKFPQYLRGMRDVEHVRQTLKAEEYRNKWRDLENTYIWGPTGVGKTRSVMDKFGYSNVYRVNDYEHPFDRYAGENIMLFDEFDSSLSIQKMNDYLDGYPIELPARYSNKQACYERVFIISNLDLREQFPYQRDKQYRVWAAFIRRIQRVICFSQDGSFHEYETEKYLKRHIKID